MFGRKKKKKVAGGGRKKKVLVIEDDALLSKVLMEALSREDLEAINVKDGSKALEVLAEFKPDLVLLDLILPGLDGFEILKQIKSNSRWRSIPVFVISNLDKIPDVKSAKALEAEEYFIKADTKMADIIKKCKIRLEQ